MGSDAAKNYTSLPDSLARYNIILIHKIFLKNLLIFPRAFPMAVSIFGSPFQFGFCKYADLAIFSDTISTGGDWKIERLSKRLGVTDEEKSKHTSFQQLSVRL